MIAKKAVANQLKAPKSKEVQALKMTVRTAGKTIHGIPPIPDKANLVTLHEAIQNELGAIDAQIKEIIDRKPKEADQNSTKALQLLKEKKASIQERTLGFEEGYLRAMTALYVPTLLLPPPPRPKAAQSCTLL